MVVCLLLISVLIVAASGAVGLAFSPRSGAGQLASTALSIVGALIAATALVLGYLRPELSRATCKFSKHLNTMHGRSRRAKIGQQQSGGTSLARKVDGSHYGSRRLC